MVLAFTVALDRLASTVLARHPGYQLLLLKDCHAFKDLSIDMVLNGRVILTRTNQPTEVVATLLVREGAQPAYRAVVVLTLGSSRGTLSRPPIRFVRRYTNRHTNAHSPAGIGRVLYADATSMLAHCFAVPSPHIGRYTLDPQTLNVGLLAMIRWTCCSRLDTIERLQSFVTIPRGAEYFVSLDVLAHARIRCDFHDAVGNIYARIEGVVQRTPPNVRVAVVGIATKYAGAAGIAHFWETIVRDRKTGLGPIGTARCCVSGHKRPRADDSTRNEHTLLLQLARDALQTTGHVNITRCGIVTGYHSQIGAPDPAHHVAEQLGLGTGPCYTLDAAAASALCAIGLAHEHLVRGDADVMLCGTACSPGTRGLVPDEGGAVLVLKRLVDAERDGNRIYGTLLGVDIQYTSSGVVNIQQMYQKFHIAPHSIQYVECHATGTTRGAQVELEALRTCFGRETMPLIGSIEDTLGHSLVAAGFAGICKLLLSIHAGVIPGGSSKKTTSWPETVQPRRGGITAAAAGDQGGTTAHAVFEEYRPHQPPSITPRPVGPPTLSIVGRSEMYGTSGGLAALKQVPLCTQLRRNTFALSLVHNAQLPPRDLRAIHCIDRALREAKGQVYWQQGQCVAVLVGMGNSIATHVSALWGFTGPSFAVTEKRHSVFRCLQLARNLLGDEQVAAAVVAGVLCNRSGAEVIVAVVLSRSTQQGAIYETPKRQWLCNSIAT